jgi:hypothetical protein
MMTNYQYLTDPFTNQNATSCISKLEDGKQVCVIPCELANTDYQAYLKWLEEGNTPLPAENT